MNYACKGTDKYCYYPCKIYEILLIRNESMLKTCKQIVDSTHCP